MRRYFAFIILMVSFSTFIFAEGLQNIAFAKLSAQDIAISLPKTVPDAVPFFLTVRTPSKDTLSFTWLGRTRSLSLGYDARSGDYIGKALLTIPIDTPEQVHPLIIRVNGRVYSYKINGTQRTYKEQHLNVNPSYVEPPQAVMNTIADDKRIRNRILATVSEQRMWTERDWVRPAQGVQTSPFGARRVYNGVRRNPHQALDLSGGIGEPVYATAPGRVLFAGMQYFTGNTIYIDHGQGVISGYSHLSAIDVHVGQRINAGQLIGKIGATGRVTGPHLHFTMYSYGIPFDPSGLVMGRQ